MSPTRRRVPTPLEVSLQRLTDAALTAPLWNWTPDVRPAVLHERRVRSLILDDEPTGDPEYT